MDIGALAGSLTTVLVPLLPYLLKAGEKAAKNRQGSRGRQLAQYNLAQAYERKGQQRSSTRRTLRRRLKTKTRIRALRANMERC